MKHAAEHKPTWKCVKEYPPPINTKILLRSAYGTAVIGVYYAEGKFTHWCGLPTFAKPSGGVDG